MGGQQQDGGGHRTPYAGHQRQPPVPAPAPPQPAVGQRHRQQPGQGHQQGSTRAGQGQPDQQEQAQPRHRHPGGPPAAVAFAAVIVQQPGQHQYQRHRDRGGLVVGIGVQAVQGRGPLREGVERTVLWGAQLQVAQHQAGAGQAHDQPGQALQFPRRQRQGGQEGRQRRQHRPQGALAGPGGQAQSGEPLQGQGQRHRGGQGQGKQPESRSRGGRGCGIVIARAMPTDSRHYSVRHYSSRCVGTCRADRWSAAGNLSARIGGQAPDRQQQHRPGQQLRQRIAPAAILGVTPGDHGQHQQCGGEDGEQARGGHGQGVCTTRRGRLQKQEGRGGLGQPRPRCKLGGRATGAVRRWING